jgi:hypothetical protein
MAHRVQLSADEFARPHSDAGVADPAIRRGGDRLPLARALGAPPLPRLPPLVANHDRRRFAGYEAKCSESPQASTWLPRLVRRVVQDIGGEQRSLVPFGHPTGTDLSLVVGLCSRARLGPLGVLLRYKTFDSFGQHSIGSIADVGAG